MMGLSKGSEKTVEWHLESLHASIKQCYTLTDFSSPQMQYSGNVAVSFTIEVYWHEPSQSAKAKQHETKTILEARLYRTLQYVLDYNKKLTLKNYRSKHIFCNNLVPPLKKKQQILITKVYAHEGLCKINIYYEFSKHTNTTIVKDKLPTVFSSTRLYIEVTSTFCLTASVNIQMQLLIQNELQTRLFKFILCSFQINLC